MSRERVLQRRLRSLETLGEAVGALRSLSAQHFRGARAPLGAVRTYRDELRRFLGVLDRPGPDSIHGGATGIILVTSDLGLVGDYAARLVQESLALRAECGPGPLICLGQRALSPLAKAGVEPVSVHPSPTSVAGLTSLLLPLVDTLLELGEAGEYGPLWLVAARFEGAGQYSPVRVPLLPVRPPVDEPTIGSSPYCDGRHLRAVVVREYLYVSLYETLLEALASEHGKRLVTAESASSWLDERMTASRRLAAAIRRETSTQELLEVIVAARSARRHAGENP